MKIYTLKRKQWINQSLERVYPFFEKPENLATITPNSLDFRLLTPSPVNMEYGRIIDYTIRFKRVPIRWRSVISTYEPPYRFVDEQLQGPYGFWHHTHQFIPKDNGTILIDEVRYALPLYLPGFLSRWIHKVLVGPELERIFKYRQAKFDELFNSNTPIANQSMPVLVEES